MESWELPNGELISEERIPITKQPSYCGALWVLKMLQSYFQNTDFVLFDGLSQHRLIKHFSIDCSKSLLCLQSFRYPLYFYPPPSLPYLLSSLYFWSWIIKWWRKARDLQWKMSLIVSHFESLVLSCFISNAMVPTQNFRTFCIDYTNLRDLPIVLHIEKGYFIFYLHWSYSFDFFFTEFHHRIFPSFTAIIKE